MASKVKAAGGVINRMLVVAVLAAGLAAASARFVRAQRPDSTSRRGRDSAVVLNAVEVRASIVPTAGPAISPDVPARVSVIDSAALHAWNPRLLTDVMARQANVSLYDDLGSPNRYTIGLRGFTTGPTVGTPAGVAVFMNGIRQNEPDAQEVNFDLLPMETVDHVEILSGPASLLGANGLGGAINLVTERGSGAPHGDITIGGGSFGGRSLDASYAGTTARDWNFLASGSASRADGWRAATASHSARGFATVGRTGETDGFTIQAYGAEARAQTAGSLPESLFDVAPRANFTAGDVDELSLVQLSATGYAAIASGRGTLTTYVRGSHADRFNANQAPDDNVRGATTNVTEGANADWRRSFVVGGNALDFRAAADAAADQVRVRLFDIAPRTNASRLATDVASPRLTVASYATTDLHLGRATLSAGARYDHIRTPFDDRLAGSGTRTNTFNRFTPRAGARVNLGGGASVYGSVGTSFRAPALLELGCADPDATCPLPFALGDDPPLEPVRAVNYELGGQALVGPLLARASVYRTDVRDEIFFIASPTSVVSGYFTNLDRTRRAGAEIDVQSMIGDRVSWYAGAALTDATFESPVTIASARDSNDVRPGDHLPLVPRVQVKGGASVHLTRRMQFGVDAQRIGTQWLRGDEANDTRPLPAYTVLDGRWSVSVRAWQMSVVAHNLFDTHAAVFGTFNENRSTGRVERFLTPHDARAVFLTLKRAFGP